MFAAIGLLGGLVGAASAADVRNMFREEVGVASQGQKDRRLAAGEALATLLVRLSGTEDVLHNGDIRAALSRADAYLEQFSYQRNEPDSKYAYQIVMEFQRKPVTELLKQAGQPLWSSNRPSILACIDASDGSRRRVLTAAGPDASEELQDWNLLLDAQAHRRGLPLRLPSAGGAIDCQAQAESMNADLILAGELRLVGDSCVAEWSMPFEGRRYEWKFGTDSHEECVALGIDAVAEVLSATYAFAAVGGDGAPLLLQVAGIAQFSDYADVILMLRELAMVSSVDVASVEGDRVAFSLDIQGDVDKLQQAIRMKRILQEEAAPVTAPQQKPGPTDPVPDPALEPTIESTNEPTIETTTDSALDPTLALTPEPPPAEEPPRPQLFYRLAAQR